jgi:hypothetical protein
LGAIPQSTNSDAVLWDQPLSAVNQNAYVNQEFSDFPTYSSFLADDFVADEDWAVSTFFVPGTGWNGFTTLLNAGALTWRIYADVLVSRLAIRLVVMILRTLSLPAVHRCFSNGYGGLLSMSI